MGVVSILGAVEKLAMMAVAVKEAEHVAMRHAVAIVQREARAEIGHYQEEAGPLVAWAELAESTKADRARNGYPENEPLLRDGTLRDSIQTAVSEVGAPLAEGAVGSNSDIAVYQELGTARIPPRSFLGGAAIRSGEKVSQVLGAGVVSALVGRDVFGGVLPLSGGQRSG